MIDLNPMRRVRLLKEHGARERYMTSEEEAGLLAQLTDRREHIRSVVFIALDTGMRRGEILALQWPHVDFVARTLYISESKSGRQRAKEHAAANDQP